MPEVADPLEALTNAIDTLCAEDPARFGDRESITDLYRQLSRAEGVVARASAAFDAQRDWEGDRARSAAGWLAAKTHVPKAQAQRRVRLARSLRFMDLVGRAWLAGDIGETQVSLIARARTPQRAETLTRDEDLLVSPAAALRYGHFARALA